MINIRIAIIKKIHYFFNNFTFEKQREFAEYISEAKQAETCLS